MAIDENGAVKLWDLLLKMIVQSLLDGEMDLLDAMKLQVEFCGRLQMHIEVQLLASIAMQITF